MSLANPWFVAAVAGWLAVFHLEWVAALLNLGRLGRPLPPILEEVFPQDTLERAADYARQSAFLDFVRDATSLTLLMVFWWSGGFGWLHRLVEAWQHGPVRSGVEVILLVGLAQNLLALPFEIWATFKLEARFGFNRTRPLTFIADHFKNLALLLLLGVPTATLVVWLFESTPLAAAYALACVAGLSILMTWLAPRVILPLFLKFRPLAQGPLRAAILDLAARLKFPVGEVSVVDGSRRSTKANAFFAGFGKTRRIALYDTLLETHQPEEIQAILAHEIGHNQCGHVPARLALGLAEMALAFGALHWVLQSPGFYAAFGVTGAPVGLGLVLFGILYHPFGFLAGAAGLALSRRHEFEADAFAAKAMGNGESLAVALKKLSHDHLSHPSPHPLTVALHYSHPPLRQRLEALARV